MSLLAFICMHNLFCVRKQKYLIMTTYRICCCFWRRYKPASDEPPEAIKAVFAKYADQSGTIGVEQLRRFMVEVQGEAVESAEAAARDVLDGFRHFRRKGLSLDSFFKYLTSNENTALYSASIVHQDMGAPLSHYFIYTSHNSYLTGNQLNSDSSDVPIVKALQRGVRVIELDMWPNEKNDDINILHGRTLTTPVGLMKCLKSIREHAFAASPYPVIITLEDHLPPDLQAKAAKMIHETFGEMLFLPKSDSLREFPSPEELKTKIIISTKPPKEFRETKPAKEREDEAQKEAEEGAWGKDVPDLDAELSAISKIDEHEASKRFHEEEEEDTEGVEQRPPRQTVAPEYKSLIAITAKKKKGGLSDALKIDPQRVTRLSLSEQVFIKATLSHGTEIVRFTQRNLLRIYPRGTRFTSSNYNPVPGWIHGAQMVALNMQGYGRALWLTHGMFRANGGCGYVKKPDLLLNSDPDRIFDPKSTLRIKKTLKVRVYMGDGWRFDFHQGHFDQYSPPDFYARVGIAGVPADTTMKRTQAIEDNWTPMWDEEFTFPLSVPELALLRIEVHEYDMSDKDDFGGQTCLPVWELRSGIRSVRLCDQKGELLPSVKLLMQFEFM